jgi:hypothetical protein
MGIVEGVAVVVIATGVLAAIGWIWRRVQRWRAQRPADDDVQIY